MRILAVDCATKAGGAAVLEDGRLLGCYTINSALTHSQTLLPMIDNLLKTLTLTVKDMDYIAVTVGPGSFTGIRIGVATVKGLSMGSLVPCIPVSSLEALAYNVSFTDRVIACCLDARREQVYNALFKFEKGELVRLSADRALAVDELYDELRTFEEGIIFVGDASKLCFEAYRDRLNCIMAQSNAAYLSAAGVCLAAQDIAASCCFHPVSYNEIMPVYLRLPQAERERLERERNEKEKKT